MKTSIITFFILTFLLFGTLLAYEEGAVPKVPTVLLLIAWMGSILVMSVLSDNRERKKSQPESAYSGIGREAK